MKLVDYDQTIMEEAQGMSGGEGGGEKGGDDGGDEQMRPTLPSFSIITVRHQTRARQSR